MLLPAWRAGQVELPAVVCVARAAAKVLARESGRPFDIELQQEEEKRCVRRSDGDSHLGTGGYCSAEHLFARLLWVARVLQCHVRCQKLGEHGKHPCGGVVGGVAPLSLTSLPWVSHVVQTDDHAVRIGRAVDSTETPVRRIERYIEDKYLSGGEMPVEDVPSGARCVAGLCSHLFVLRLAADGLCVAVPHVPCLQRVERHASRHSGVLAVPRWPGGVPRSCHLPHAVLPLNRLH